MDVDACGSVSVSLGVGGLLGDETGCGARIVVEIVCSAPKKCYINLYQDSITQSNLPSSISTLSFSGFD